MNAYVIEHPVQQYADAPAVRLANQRGQVFGRAKIRIDGKVIGRGVLVVKISGEHGVEVQALHRCV